MHSLIRKETSYLQIAFVFKSVFFTGLQDTGKNVWHFCCCSSSDPLCLARNHQQNKKTTNRVVEGKWKWCFQQGANIWNI